MGGHSVGTLGRFSDFSIAEYPQYFAITGMSVFFVLSGFVIHYNYRDIFLSKTVARSVCEFASARFARLYPLYFVLLLVALGAENFFTTTRRAASSIAAPLMAYHLSLTQTWWYVVLGDHELANWPFGISWSISTEMYFYAVFAAAVFFIASLKARAPILIAIVYSTVVMIGLAALYAHLPDPLQIAQWVGQDEISGAQNVDDSFFRWFLYLSPYVRVLEFLLGCMAAQAFMQISQSKPSRHEQWGGRAALGLAVLFLTFEFLVSTGWLGAPFFRHYLLPLSMNFLCAPAIAIIIFCLARYDSWLGRILSLPALLFLGEISYSIYLLHIYVLRLFPCGYLPLGIASAAEACWCVLASMLVTVLLSYATYTLIEVPGRIWNRRLFARSFSYFSSFDASRTTVTANRAMWSATVAFGLAAFAIFGQAAHSDQVVQYIHRNVLQRSDIVVVSASYGLNCLNFAVPPPSMNRVSSGNATDKLKHACNLSTTCDVLAAVEWLGDPANSCGKDFRVVYQCTGQPGERTGFIPAEAAGKHIVMSCSRKENFGSLNEEAE